MRPTRAATATLLGGLALLAVVQAVGPLRGLALYDGVIVEDPYRWVAPTTGQAADPTSAASTLDVSGGASPAIVIATTENPPQAQLIASPGTFAIPNASTTLIAAITPVRPSADQARTPISGNVYRFSVVGDGGTPVSLASGARATIILRAPASVPGLTLARWDGIAWRALTTSAGGVADIFDAQTDTLGDIAFATTSADISQLLLIAVGIVIVVVIAGGLLLLRRPAPRARVIPAPARTSDGLRTRPVRKSDTKRRR